MKWVYCHFDHPNMNLKEQFEAQGYLILEDFASPEECKALMQRGKKLAEQFDYRGHASIFQTEEQTRVSDDYFLNSGGNISFFFEKDAFQENGELRQDIFRSLNKIGHALHDLDPVFMKFSRNPKLAALAEKLGMKDALLIQSMLIFKHAKIGGVVDIHQDSSFLYTEPESCIGFWFALEDATIENGCMWAKPGGHKRGLHSWFKRKADGNGTEMQILDTEPFSTEGMVPLEVKQGTCIVLHGLLPHFSQPNTSGKSRQAYAIHTINREAYYPEANWLRRKREELRGFSE
jgi:phytanoyl-CoA hydroxylase